MIIVLNSLMKITKSPTFCPCPWTDIRLSMNGQVGVCSYSPDIGTTNNQSIEDIIYGTELTAIRDAISHGEWHRKCSYCKNSEEKGGRSQRMMNVESINQEHQDFIDNNPTKFMLRNSSINWNNLCNLACNYCNPKSSTTWQTVVGQPLELSSMGDTSVNWLVNNSTNLESMLIGGGEPLLHKNVNDLLTQLTSSDKKINISVTTNLSVELNTNPMFNTIKNNPNLNVLWMISFDGTGDHFEYVRHGADWDQFQKNIETLKNHNQLIQAHPAYGLYCAFDLVEYVDFCVANELEIFWCDIYSPKELDIRYAPTSLRKLAVENINQVLVKYKDSQLNLRLDTLHKYREMALIGSSFLDVADADPDIDKALTILAFNHKIESILPKKKSFAELWPKIHSILLTEAAK
jgi:MoaA/NifB/PqqE/SkfB family radical SAM enzyme